MNTLRFVTEKLKAYLDFSFVFRLNIVLLLFFLVLLGYPAVTPHSIMVAVSFASLMAFIYLFNKVTDTNEDSVNIKAGLLPEYLTRRVRLFSFLCLVLPIFYLAFYYQLLIPYLIVALLGFFYSFKLRIGDRIIRLKQLLAIKNITSAFIWTIPPTAVRIIETNTPNISIFIISCVIFFATFAIEAIWDIRDIEGDRQFGIRTFANRWGYPVAKKIAIASLSISLILSFIGSNAPTMLALVISIVFVAYASPFRHSWFYHSLVLIWVLATSLSIAMRILV